MSGNVYYYDFACKSGITIATNAVNEDDIALNYVSGGTAESLIAAGTYTHVADGNTSRVFVWCSDDADPDTHNMMVMQSASTAYWGPTGGTYKSGNYITFDGIIFQGGHYNGGYAVAVSGNGMEFKNCVFGPSGHYGFKVFGDTYLFNTCQWDSINGLIENSIFRGCKKVGIDITGGDNWTVRNCEFNGEGKTYVEYCGIVAKNGSSNCVIDSCWIHDFTVSPHNDVSRLICIGGLSTYYTYSAAIKDGEGLIPESTDQVVKNCIISNCNGFTELVYFEGALRGRLLNNIFNNCEAYLYIMASHPCDSGNYVNGSMSYDCVVANNIFSNCTVATTIKSFFQMSDTTILLSSRNWTIQNNCVYGAQVASQKYYLNGTPGATKSLAEALADWGFGTNDIYTDPLFVNASGLFNTPTDFKLQSTSPCINAGADVGLTTDYNGDPVIGLPDIGAYEFFLA